MSTCVATAPLRKGGGGVPSPVTHHPSPIAHRHHDDGEHTSTCHTRQAIRCRPVHVCLLSGAFDPSQRAVASPPPFHSIPGADGPEQNAVVFLAAAAVVLTVTPQQATSRQSAQWVQAPRVAGEEGVRASGARRAQRARRESCLLSICRRRTGCRCSMQARQVWMVF